MASYEKHDICNFLKMPFHQNLKSFRLYDFLRNLIGDLIMIGDSKIDMGK
jgi:hypothetical protein